MLLGKVILKYETKTDLKMFIVQSEETYNLQSSILTKIKSVEEQGQRNYTEKITQM